MRATTRGVMGGLCALAVSALWASGVGHAQAAPPLRRIPLKPANAVLDAEYVGLTSLRELADGRVILTDGRDQSLWLLDFARNTSEPLSRKGKGPLEYSFVGILYPLAGDSTIMSEVISRRWLLFDGDKPARTVPPDDPVVSKYNLIQGADARGRVLARLGRPTKAGVDIVTRADSFTVALVHRTTGAVDTIARLREMPRRIETRLNDKGQISASSTQATESGAQGESVSLHVDGTVAVIRLEPLRVEWRLPDGSWMRGAPLPVYGPPVDAAERASIAARRAESRRDMARLGLPVAPDPPMPKTLPALASLQALPLADGRIALRRRSTATQPATRYVIVNRRGGADGEIVLAPKEAIVGFGQRAVYVSFTDDDDIVRLRRHPWP